MTYEFKSRSAGTVVMNRSFAEAILEAVGHEPAPKGITAVEQIPAAIKTVSAIPAGRADATAIAAHAASFTQQLRDRHYQHPDQ